MSNPTITYKKLPFATVAISALSILKTFLIPIIVVFFINFGKFTLNFNSPNFWSTIFTAGIWGVIIIFTLLAGVIKWWTFFYWFEDGELRVKYGLFVKKKRYISFERIQTLNYHEGIFHRIFGLVKVQVETAGSTDGKPEVEFTALTREAADQIEIEMRKAKAKPVTNEETSIEEDTVTEPVPEIVTEAMYKMSLKDLFVLASTSGGIGIIISGLLALLSQASDVIPYEKIYGELAAIAKYGVLIILLTIFVLFILGWVASLILTFLKYYDFKIVIQEEKMIITRGLIEKKRLTIPLNRVQAIKIVENPFRQMFGYATVHLESAGSNNDNNKESVVMFPLIKMHAIEQHITHLFPDYEWQQNYVPAPKKALPYYYRIDFFYIVPIIAVASYFLYPWGLLTLLLIPFTMGLGVWQHRTAAYCINDKQLTLRYRGISRVTFFVQKHRIQSLSSRQSYFQKKNDVMGIHLSVMSGASGAKASIRALDQADVEHILEWYDSEKIK
ncbi:UPF0699 transmembrane protein YdbT [Lysinibacillus alkalisoli]|uniref:UPF0699 transmembrane protein YdbT n=1 Tax=Lysinibacillus alkalisoli TaxID=1911548 RepID=A0A917G6A3_9BACI|nr:PH domain-containing protein [Lysinibacillus alkalisoli]GGG24963.1 UPF0699 transmembrane protein YdbT [Lysinibacillus alkalisoli]